MRMAPLVTSSLTPPVRSLAASDTARSASANAARGARMARSLVCGMTCEYGRKLRIDELHREAGPADEKNAFGPLWVMMTFLRFCPLCRPRRVPRRRACGARRLL